MDEETIQVITRALRLAGDAPIELIAKAVDSLPEMEVGFAVQRLNVALTYSSDPELSERLLDTLAFMKARVDKHTAEAAARAAARAETSAPESAAPQPEP